MLVDEVGKAARPLVLNTQVAQKCELSLGLFHIYQLDRSGGRFFNRAGPGLTITPAFSWSMRHVV